MHEFRKCVKRYRGNYKVKTFSCLDQFLCMAFAQLTYRDELKGAIKLHTLLDLRGSIPTFIGITDGKVHDVNILDELMPEPGCFYIIAVILIFIAFIS